MTRSMQPDAEPRNIHDRLPPASAEAWVERGRNAADLADSVTAETDMAEAGRHCQRVLLKDVIKRVDDHAPRIVRGRKDWRNGLPAINGIGQSTGSGSENTPMGIANTWN